MNKEDVVYWILKRLGKKGRVTQEEVVQELIASNSQDLLIENLRGKRVLSEEVLTELQATTRGSVVWFSSEGCWRWREFDDSA